MRQDSWLKKPLGIPGAPWVGKPSTLTTRLPEQGKSSLETSPTGFPTTYIADSGTEHVARAQQARTEAETKTVTVLLGKCNGWKASRKIHCLMCGRFTDLTLQYYTVFWFPLNHVMCLSLCWSLSLGYFWTQLWGYVLMGLPNSAKNSTFWRF